MNLLYILFFITGLKAYEYDAVSKKCIAENYKPLPNNFLLGTWYMIYQFGLSLAETEYCPTIEFTKPTATHLDEYRKKYNLKGLPFNFEGNPILLKDTAYTGLLMGDTEVKSYVLDPQESSVTWKVFRLYTYKRLSDKYVVFYICEARRHVMWLLSRERNPAVNETDSLINTSPIFKHKKVRRYCLDKIDSFPLVQNGKYCSCHCCTV